MTEAVYINYEAVIKIKIHQNHGRWLAKWMDKWSDGQVIELYGEMVEDDDQAGDCSGKEGDRMGWKTSVIFSFAFVAIEIDGKTSIEVFGWFSGHDFFKNHPS